MSQKLEEDAVSQPLSDSNGTSVVDHVGVPDTKQSITIFDEKLTVKPTLFEDSLEVPSATRSLMETNKFLYSRTKFIFDFAMETWYRTQTSSGSRLSGLAWLVVLGMRSYIRTRR